MKTALEARQSTLERISGMGFPQPPEHLPVLADDESPFVLRPVQDVINRALVLNVRINLSFGMPLPSAREWLAGNGLMSCLSPRESDLVAGMSESDDHEQAQVEGLWALTWALSITPILDHGSYCGDHLVTLLPDLRAGEPIDEWRSRCKPVLRSRYEVMSELDLLYVTTWGLANANISGARAPGAVDQYVFWERRRALEFIRADSGAGHAAWDQINLST